MGSPSPAATVHADIALQSVDLLGARHRLDAAFGYDPRDPFAVTLTFRTTQVDVVWTFARELLLEGVDSPAGDGDVHVWPCEDADGRPVVMIELSSDDGELMVQAPRWAVRRFVARALRAVPVGAESGLVDIDAVLGALLAG